MKGRADRKATRHRGYGETQRATNTLKALANSSPGLRFGNPGKGISFVLHATLKELRRGSRNETHRNSFRVAKVPRGAL